MYVTSIALRTLEYEYCIASSELNGLEAASIPGTTQPAFSPRNTSPSTNISGIVLRRWLEFRDEPTLCVLL